MSHRFKFHSEEPGFCRVYYKAERGDMGRNYLYCIQNDGGWGTDDYKFYSCTSDGEPSFEVSMPPESDFDELVFPSSNKRR